MLVDTTNGPAVIDGRNLRSRRTRQALIDALIALVEEGDLRPTAPRIAQRAGVSLRSIYHHFDDLELLFAETAQRQIERTAPLRQPLPTGGPLPVRVDALLRQKIRIWEAVTPIRTAASLQEPFSPQLRAVRSEIHRRNRGELATVFAVELDSRSPGDALELLDALDAAVNWMAWQVMRTDVGLSIERAEAVLRRTLMSLLTDGHALELLTAVEALVPEPSRSQ
jgi:TetR/AcrR family transcriptional regulator, regulator of autoinduction and epiphytic fitness